MSRFVNLCWRVAIRVAHRGRLGYWFVFRPRGQGVYVAVWCDGQILIIRNSYRRQYTLPCGAWGRRESAVAAACRELREEAGVDVPPDELIRVGEFYTREQYLRDHCVVFEAKLGAKPPVGVDGREVVWADFVPFEEARRLPMTDVVRQYFAWKVDQRD